jgi:hypothetical protein
VLATDHSANEFLAKHNPSGRDATRKQLRFHLTPLRQRELLPAAKSRWVDAVNMSVACKMESQFVFTILG